MASARGTVPDWPLSASEISSRKVWQVPYMAWQPLRGSSTTTCEPEPKSAPEAEKPFLAKGKKA